MREGCTGIVSRAIVQTHFVEKLRKTLVSYDFSSTLLILYQLGRLLANNHGEAYAATGGRALLFYYFSGFLRYSAFPVFPALLRNSARSARSKPRVQIIQP